MTLTLRRTGAIAAAGAVAALSLAGCGSSVLSLTTGDCVDLPDDGDASVTTVKIKQCDEAHQGEVFTTVTIDDSETYPEDMESRAQKGCLAAFKDYVGTDYPASALDIRFLAPSQDSWDKQDDRTIACLAVQPEGGTLDQSVKGSNK